METEDVCILLLKCGADCDKIDNKGRAAIDYAAQAGNKDCVCIINDYKQKTRKTSNKSYHNAFQMDI